MLMVDHHLYNTTHSHLLHHQKFLFIQHTSLLHILIMCSSISTEWLSHSTSPQCHSKCAYGANFIRSNGPARWPLIRYVFPIYYVLGGSTYYVLIVQNTRPFASTTLSRDSLVDVCFNSCLYYTRICRHGPVRWSISTPGPKL